MCTSERDTDLLCRTADTVCREIFGDRVFLRALIEFTNYCAQNCLYCGIRRDNHTVRRYRLDEQTILSCIKRAVDAGIKTCVLQGGEDPGFSADRLTALVSLIRSRYSDEELAITLSCGILRREEYRRLKEAGADRYLLRFETSDPTLHKKLRAGVEIERRLEALMDLKDLGFEVGSGFMVGLPGETDETRYENIMLCKKLDLDMAGIGPFIPHPATPLARAEQSPIELTIRCTAQLRIALPLANLPATTGAGSLHPRGRELMLGAGANVLMPNVSPVETKKDYELYPHKICVEEDGIECLSCLDLRVSSVNKRLSYEMGPSPSWAKRMMLHAS